VALSPDGRFAAAGGWDRSGDNGVYVFDAAAGKLIRRLGKLDNVISVTNPFHVWTLTHRRFADAALQLPH